MKRIELAASATQNNFRQHQHQVIYHYRRLQTSWLDGLIDIQVFAIWRFVKPG